MALYLCSFKNITRSEGRSAVAAAAYRSGEKLTNRWDGCTHDYTRKGGIEYTAILLPFNAPAAYADRSVLWNAVEQAEKSSRCRLCRECVLALPVELTLDQQIELVKAYVQQNFVDAGMCADIAIHNPVKTDTQGRPLDAQGKPTSDPAQFQHLNPHAHILLTVRPMDRDGKWESKSQVEYRCKRGKEEQGFTAAEYKAAAAEGWEKQYRYKAHGKKIWLTPSEAASQGLELSHRISRSPRTTPHGRENPTTAHWNSPLRICEWRENWANLVNQKFESLGRPERVDHRSYLDQGKAQLPTVHLGPSAARRQPSNADEINAAVHNFNRSLQKYQKIDSALRSKLSQTSQQINACRAALAANQASSAALSRSVNTLSRLTSDDEDAAQRAQATLDLMQAVTAGAMDTIHLLEQELEQISRFQPTRRRDLLRQLHAVQEKLDNQTTYLQSLLQQEGFSDQASVDLAKAAAAQKRQKLSSLTQSLYQLQAESEQIRQQLADTLAGVPEELRTRILPPEQSASTQQKPKSRHR